MRRQQGFTLIELVIVIVILGILAAAAVPKFVDLEDEARDAALEGTAGALSSAFAINYAAVQAGDGVDLSSVTDLCDITDTTVQSIMTTPVDTSKYETASSSSSLDCSAGSNGDSQTCTLADSTDTGKTASFTAICAK